jgi:hypothetical protein
MRHLSSYDHVYAINSMRLVRLPLQHAEDGRRSETAKGLSHPGYGSI